MITAPSDTPELVKHREMMKKGGGVRVQIKGPSGKTTAGEMRIQHWNAKERRIR